MIVNLASNFQYNEVPKDYCVIRVADSILYLHYNKGEYTFIGRMNGCIVMNPELAEQIKTLLESCTVMDNLEIVKFNIAYKEHGLTERQIAFN